MALDLDFIIKQYKDMLNDKKFGPHLRSAIADRKYRNKMEKQQRIEHSYYLQHHSKPLNSLKDLR